MFDKKYVLEPNKLVRNRKMTLEDIILYLLVECGRTNAVEVLSFY